MAATVQHRRRRATGWTVAIAILLNGWLPILFQAALAAEPEAQGSVHAHHAQQADQAEHTGHAAHAQRGHAHHAGGSVQPEPTGTPASQGLPECPVLHGAVCLCAALVKVLPGPAATAVLAAALVSRARFRLRPQRPRRRVRVVAFEARAPPFSDRALHTA